jgi:hypothetical protein
MSDLFSGLQDTTFTPGDPAHAIRSIGVEVDGLCIAFPVKRFTAGDHILVPEPALSFLRDAFSVTDDRPRHTTERHHDRRVAGSGTSGEGG